MRFGAAVSAVVLSSILATMPATLRIAPALAGSVGFISIWTALVALACAPLAVMTVAVRHALAALRLFDRRALAAGVAVALVWGLLTTVALTALGAFLRATTHHHGLAGVTFGCFGVVVAAFAALLAVRVVEWATAVPAPVRWGLMAVAGVTAGAMLAAVTRLLGHSEAGAALAVDVSAFAIAAAFGGSAFPSRSRPFAPLAFAGPPVAAIVLFTGFATLRASTSLRAAIDADAPILSVTTSLAGDADASSDANSAPR